MKKRKREWHEGESERGREREWAREEDEEDEEDWNKSERVSE